ncbi:MAG: GLUG motif-containing protein [Bacillota bacterium]|nr:GLUG motif-containing protein [Bacillota bacterium]
MKNKKFLSLILVLVLLLTLVIQAYGVSFTDVETHWAQDNINKWVDNGFIKGYPDGTFKPNGNVTGVEFGLLIERKLGVSVVLGDEELTRLDVALVSYEILKSLGYDIDSDDLSEEEKIDLIKDLSILTGYKDGTLRLENKVSRAESLVIIDRIEDYHKKNEDKNNQAKLFSEKYKIEDFFIREIPFSTTLEEFKGNIYVSEGATYEIYKFNEETSATRVTNGYKVIVTSEDESITNIYMIDKESNPVRPDPIPISSEESEDEESSNDNSGNEESGDEEGSNEDNESGEGEGDNTGITNDKELVNGDGSIEAPYQITNWYHLNEVRNYLDSNFILMADLDENAPGYNELAENTADEGRGWSPIGRYSQEYKGIFDGNDKTISSVYINRSYDYLGLFGITDSATIKDLTLTNFSISGNSYVGSLVGQSFNTTIKNIEVSGEVSGTYRYAGGLIGELYNGVVENIEASTTVSGLQYTGGLIGLSKTNSTILNSNGEVSVKGIMYTGGLIGSHGDGIVENSNALGTVEVLEKDGYLARDAGGLIGKFNGTIKNSYANVNILGKGENSIGGFLGYSYNSTITGCYATGSVTSSQSKSNSIGGLIGTSYSNDIIESYAIGEVTGNNNVGGLVGYNSGNNNENGSIINSYATGNVNGRINEANVGGLVGSNDEFGFISDSFSAGNVIGDGNVGGLIGSNNGEITKSYSEGSVTADSNVGGLVGYSYGLITESYAIGSVNADNSVGGLVGRNSGDIINSYSIGNITGDNSLGGLTGRSDGNIEKSYSEGDVTGNESVGGLTGTQSGGNIIDSYSLGNVTSNYTAGGIAGFQSDGNIKNTYAVGTVVSGGYFGSLVGYQVSSSYLYDSFGLSKDSINTIGGQNGTVLGRVITASELEMMKEELYTSDTFIDGVPLDSPWDFTNIWAIDEDVSFPYLLENHQ